MYTNTDMHSDRQINKHTDKHTHNHRHTQRTNPHSCWSPQRLKWKHVALHQSESYPPLAAALWGSLVRWPTPINTCQWEWQVDLRYTLCYSGQHHSPKGEETSSQAPRNDHVHKAFLFIMARQLAMVTKWGMSFAGSSLLDMAGAPADDI